ncbi:PTS sugar transporter subunit IIB [Brevibacillus daliensis]|uniref:PTS sugar transporter subunit IIB n=1 Tax=Brevibacillus daliensis TaxID=2892995 RepID=UPI001E336DDD|nr:PTS fructose transporter subunit IIB [Brevibacillus daliensis]
MKKVNILSVCGSGTVSSAMVGQKIKEMLGEHGYDCEIHEVSPGMVAGAVGSSHVDLIAFTSPFDPNDAEGIPQLNAVGVLTGMDEETFLEKALEVLKDLK